MRAKTTAVDSARVKVPRGRPQQGEAEGYRQRILDATTAVFLEKGFARSSTNEIARRAQTSKQTLYTLFPTKAALFVGVMSAHTEQLFARHMDFLESSKAPRDALTDIGRMMLKMFSAPEFLALYRILVAEAHNFPDLARELWCECVEQGYGLLAEYLRTRRIGGPNYRKSAAQFISFVLGDFVINVMLNPDLELSERAVRSRVRQAVEDFLRLHSSPSTSK
jgi:TetR/AcrR family transcriptional repressor of mexJK operon